MDANYLPAAPPPEPPPKSNRLWKIVACVAVVVAAVAIGGSINQPTTVSGGGSSPVAVSEPVEPVACLDKDAGLAASGGATDALTDAQRAAERFDVDAMSDSLHEAAAYVGDASDAMDADPAIAGPLAQASDAYESAADNVADGDLDGALTQMELGASYVEDATTATGRTDVPAC